MKIVAARQAVSDSIGRDAELIQAKAMQNRVLVLITDDRIKHDKRLPTIRTRRLSVFQRDKLLGSFIIDTMRE